MFGFRPEETDVHLSAQEGAAPATVETAHFQGDRVIYQLRLGTEAIQASTAARGRLAPNAAVWVSVARRPDSYLRSGERRPAERPRERRNSRRRLTALIAAARAPAQTGRTNMSRASKRHSTARSALPRTASAAAISCAVALVSRLASAARRRSAQPAAGTGARRRPRQHRGRRRTERKSVPLERRRHEEQIRRRHQDDRPALRRSVREAGVGADGALRCLRPSCLPALFPGRFRRARIPQGARPLFQPSRSPDRRRLHPRLQGSRHQARRQDLRADVRRRHASGRLPQGPLRGSGRAEELQGQIRLGPRAADDLGPVHADLRVLHPAAEPLRHGVLRRPRFLLRLVRQHLRWTWAGAGLPTT